ncbi:folate-binding protein YgfZ [Alloacidobacterium dinghuense]|uniref:Folate-binding protein YgfZ n=1 Tax=Alloacidobacterium dinghuense TaxID=2763107 RepID=A0A7G8BCZ2_9BACT|nr:folate-binding protein YgfZ [Alloacidobacterium dinghuense]QNI30412.1 folate-binding protein YgfZ [Alloacidobacterium dinghuense]
MSEPLQIAETGLTPLAALFPAVELQMHLGRITPRVFAGIESGLASLIHSAAIYDLGYLTRVRITGDDSVRWLNGMVTNTVQSLPQGYGNYTLILNAQGRIQGDGYVFRATDHLLLETDRVQSSRLLPHLDHFIIMDDVELHELDAASTTLGLTGPQAPSILKALGLPVPHTLAFVPATLQGIAITIVSAYSVRIPRFELWLSAEHLAEVWRIFTEAGAAPAGFAALESLRILEGVPRYGVDMTDRYLPQETNQSRALNFNKGCYLGQEIVERIRSRATVHRTLRQFELHGAPPPLGTEIFAEGDDKPIGEITSAARYALPGLPRTFALGMIRVEALERKAVITYSGGRATPLDEPPVLP